jgi:hypothetical protein
MIENVLAETLFPEGCICLPQKFEMKAASDAQIFCVNQAEEISLPVV